MRTVAVIGSCAGLVAAAAISAQIYPANIPAEHPSLRYSSAPVDDPVSRLARQLDSGSRHLAFRDDGPGYLPGLLNALGIAVDSQSLVFSKTSFQAARISPRNPRAIYFTDDAAVGWVRGGDGFELAGLDPQQGIIFYTLDTKSSDHPRIVRRQECLHCHQGTATLGVPGIFVGSVFPNAAGMPYREAALITDHTTPFADRWGGWYVNAARGQQRDRANAIAPDPAEPKSLDTKGRQNLPSLEREFDAAGYLSPVSDIVALMTLEHQTKMTNLLIRAGWEWRTSGQADIDAVVDYMLFAGEAPLREPVEGVSTFTRTFAQRGPVDGRGRGLRQFDLHTRLFRYPLSYMIYSAAFEGLPPAVRERVLHRLYDVLNGADAGAKYPALTPETKSSILSILRETKPGLPDYWRVAEK
jgi:hypothetical protein